MANKKCSYLRYIVKELKSYNVDIELDYQTGEILGVRIPPKHVKHKKAFKKPVKFTANCPSCKLSPNNRLETNA
jgi:hypothetical protein